jgi:acetyltransferase
MIAAAHHPDLTMAVTSEIIPPPLVHRVSLPGMPSITIRPAGPEDSRVIQTYIRQLSPTSRYNRFLGVVKELSPTQLHGLTHADHRYRLTMIAETVVAGACMMIGEACYAIAADGINCEIAVSVADDWQRRTLGTLLLTMLASRARAFGVRHLVGEVLRSNGAMTALARKLGWVFAAVIEDARLVRITKQLVG